MALGSRIQIKCDLVRVSKGSCCAAESTAAKFSTAESSAES